MTVCPTAYGPGGVSTRFSTEMSGASWIGTVSDEGGEVTGSPPDVPDAVAVLSIEPLATSAGVTVYVAVQVTVSPGARLVTGQETGPVFGSSTARSSMVVPPALVTTNSYGTCEPAVRSPGSGCTTCFTRLSRGGNGRSVPMATFRMRWVSVNRPVEAANPNL